MKLTFLGTSAGKPTKERNVTALALEFDQDNKWYLFDCGEATQHQILKTSLSIGKLSAIFITHLHGDHYYGLPGLLSSKTLDKAFAPLSIYGPKGLKQFIECVMDISEEHLGYKLEIIEIKANTVLSFDKFSLKVLPLVHSVESFAFCLQEHNITNKLDEAKLRQEGLEPSPFYGELKRGNDIIHEGKEFVSSEYMLAPVQGRKCIIAGDNSEPDVMGEYLDNLDLLVHESTYTQEVYDALPTKFLHTTAKKLGEVAQKHHIKNLIATHISARYSQGSSYDAQMICDEIKVSYTDKCFVANDFDIFYLSREGMLEKL
ncbi:MBL fold metallo-hydrolase [Sulfurimonas paralvinellae]|uniref:Ribonuclease Z n=1 Tax=Sulfurimonas paralvinellae TaxID=317658 RepID=A0A7M1B9L0_9BACT|nr:MBL fold metallo-hydrolase [Sulfurimonas paralvinellae]QOP46419.1 MBL fold metallo-hydrolase [Sulfurimonas paralvinellae]